MRGGKILEGATLAFDLDGTLVDSAPDIIRHLNTALGSFAHHPIDACAGRALIGRGARAMLDAATRQNGVTLSSRELDMIFHRFVELYSAQPIKLTRLYPGALDAVHCLIDCGASLVVCTNKLTSIAEAVLTGIGVRSAFDGVFGYDAVSACKPSPAHLVEAVTQIGGDLTRTVMVGDSSADACCAHNAGVPLVVVSFGYNDVPHAQLRPAVLIDHFDELPPSCAKIVQANKRSTG
nr:HAD hydrolase-like protein [Qipengyuania qiaonensis]